MSGLAFRGRAITPRWGRAEVLDWSVAERGDGGRLQRAWRGYGLRILLVIAMYYAAAHIGYAFRFAGPVASVVWLPVGVGIAALYFEGLRLWPGIVIGDLLVNNYSTLPVGAAIGQSFGNLCEVVVAAVLLRRLTRRESPLATVREVTGVFVAIGAGTVLSATIGTLSLWLGNVVGASELGLVWRTWWLGDFCGAMIVLPLALAWFTPSPWAWRRGRVLELAMTLAVVAGLSAVAIGDGNHLSYLAFPVLIWLALRFGPRGATLGITIGSAVMVWATTHYLGPLAFRAINENLFDIQLYLAVTAVSTLAVAALAVERGVLVDRLRASRTRIVVAADEERRRLERNLHDGAQQRLLALAARMSLAASDRESAPMLAASLGAAQSEVLAVLEELRELAQGCRPAALSRFGLARAIEGVAARSSTPVELIELPEVRLDETAETAAYYVVLEAVANAQRYAHASVIRIQARVSGPNLRLAVEDDGVGGASEQDDLGLKGLRDRVEATGGVFEVESKRGCGTSIRATIPATAMSTA